MSLATIWNSIESWFKKEKPIIDDAFSKANLVVNILKTFIASPSGQTIISIISAFVPAAAVVNVVNSIATYLTDFGHVVAEEGKPLEEIVADGVAAINSKLSGSSKALALSNLAALIGKLISDANGGTATIQQAIVTTPVVYNPATLTDAEPDAPVKQAA